LLVLLENLNKLKGTDLAVPSYWTPLEENLSLIAVPQGLPPFFCILTIFLPLRMKLNYMSMELKTGSDEWRMVEQLWEATVPRERLVKIERVQNRVLWRKYLQEKELVDSLNGPDKLNEKWLFHGPATTSPQEIYDSTDGFDMRFSSLGKWGIGIYFAVNAS